MQHERAGLRKAARSSESRRSKGPTVPTSRARMTCAEGRRARRREAEASMCTFPGAREDDALTAEGCFTVKKGEEKASRGRSAMEDTHPPSAVTDAGQAQRRVSAPVHV